MGPPESLVGGVWVQGRVGVQVMVAVRGHPLDGLPLHCQHAAVGQRILQPLGRREAAVAQLPVEAECDSQAACKRAQRLQGRFAHSNLFNFMLRDKTKGGVRLTCDKVAAQEESHHGPREGEGREEAEPVHHQHKDGIPIVLSIPTSPKQRCFCSGIHVR